MAAYDPKRTLEKKYVHQNLAASGYGLSIVQTDGPVV
jgi:hypothetical protein